jgi:4-alpha-glucanotransferase
VTDRDVRDLARRAGIAADWVDATGTPRAVSPETLRGILGAIELPCANNDDVAESRRRLAARDKDSASFLTVTTGASLQVAGAHRSAPQLTLEDGTRRKIAARRAGTGQLEMRINAPPGYHRLQIGNREITLAVAPRRSWTVDDVGGGRRLWGLAAQIYSLARPGDGGIGDTGAVAMLARAAARLRADAIALSPSHAMFSADLHRYGPYSPSSRLFLNPLYADPEAVFGAARVAALRKGDAARRVRGNLIDWPKAATAKFDLLRRLFEQFRMQELAQPKASALAADFRQFCAAQGELLRDHAAFEVLQADRVKRDSAQWSWRTWPADWRDPRGATLEHFARQHADDILFHMFAQWVADRAFGTAQATAKDAGMRIGLIGDVAVGMDAGGSHAWSRQADLLVGLSVGAPPDAFNPRGQNWGLTTFSPQALVAGGFAPFLATLRAAMRHAGGVRIDHAMGMARLWLIPDGAGASDGAYVSYPLDDLLRLTALESRRHKAVVIAEDLGTVPPGFGARLDKIGIAGMRVLWFERDGLDFRKPQHWDVNAAALTTTHDLPTVAGWWRGADIRLRASLKMLTVDEAKQARRERAADRRALWRSFQKAGVARGKAPAPTKTDRVVDAAIAFIARTRSQLSLIPIEDALGLVEQPNVPGTIDEHPNWRRRLPRPADRLLEPPAVRRRLAPLTRRRN